MAITFREAGAWSSVGTTSPLTVTIPASAASTDQMFLVGVWKDHTITATATAGWDEVVQFTDGVVDSAPNVGSVTVGVWSKQHDGSESNPQITFSAAPVVRTAMIVAFQRGGSDIWAVPQALTAAITNWTTSEQTVTSSATATVPDGAAVIGVAGIRDDTATFTRPTDGIGDDGSPALTWNGNYAEQPATHASSTTGNDIAADAGYRLVTTGAAGVNLTQKATLSAAETGSAVWIIQGLAVFTGTGAISVPAATVAGTGAEVFTATGAISVPAPTVAGTGAEIFTATGAIAVPAATISGTGAEILTATGAIAVPAATVDGTGDHTAGAVEPEGTGAISVPAATVAGTGSLDLTGSGAISVPAPTVAGTGAEVFTATGAVIVPAATVAGSGQHIENVTGSGAVIVPAATVAGDGLLAEAVTGTGAIMGSAAMVAGSGSVVGVGGDGSGGWMRRRRRALKRQPAKKEDELEEIWWLLV